MGILGMNQKGNITDTAYMVIILFASALTIVIVYMILGRFAATAPPQINATIITQGQSAVSLLDLGMASLMVGLALFSILSAYFIRTHPIFFVVGLVVLILTTYIAALISNISYDIFNSTGISAYTSAFPITMNIMQYLPYEIFILGLLILLAMFAKGDQGGGSNY